jgi:hypothetical protein
MSFGEWFVRAFDELTPHINGIFESAKSYSLSDWRTMQQGLVTASGAASIAIPGLHLVGMAADVAFLMNRMSVCSYGIGGILGNTNSCGNILETEDFAIILARWSGSDSITDAAIGKTAAELCGKVGGKAAAKVLAKTMAEKAGLLVGKKLAGKATVGFIPFLGAAVGGGESIFGLSPALLRQQKNGIVSKSQQIAVKGRTIHRIDVMNCIIVQPRQTGPRLQAVDRNPMMIGSHQFKINESLDPNQADQRCMHTKQSITHFFACESAYSAARCPQDLRGTKKLLRKNKICTIVATRFPI